MNGAVAARGGHNQQSIECDVDLSLTDQLAIVYDPGEQTREHQPYRGFRIDAWPTVVRAVGDLFP